MRLTRLVYGNRSWVGLLSSWSYKPLRYVLIGICIVLAGLIFTRFVGNSQQAFWDRYQGGGVAAISTHKPAKPVMPRTLPPFDNLGNEASDAQAIGRAMSAERFGDSHWPSLQKLWMAESGWRAEARNRSSGACGIPQALPCSKIPDMSLKGQLEWGLEYIARRYGNPSNAWRFWQGHRWY